MKILVCLKDEYERKQSMSMIKSEFPEVEFDFATNGQEAIDFIARDQSYGTVVTEYELDHKNGGEIYRFTQMQMLEMPFILISTIDLSSDPNIKDLLRNSSANSHIPKPVSQKQLKEALRKAFGSDLELTEHKEEGWIGVEIEKLARCKLIPCDVYIKLKSSGKMIKIINANADEYKDILQKYIKKKIQTLYVEKDMFPRLEEYLR